MVHAGLQSLEEQPLSLVRRVGDEGRAAQDCNARIVSRSAEASCLHGRQRTKSAWAERARNLILWFCCTPPGEQDLLEENPTFPSDARKWHRHWHRQPML